MLRKLIVCGCSADDLAMSSSTCRFFSRPIVGLMKKSNTDGSPKNFSIFSTSPLVASRVLFEFATSASAEA
ncbi:hypothetical protein ACFX14_002759 [Malus domestica]